MAPLESANTTRTGFDWRPTVIVFVGTLAGLMITSLGTLHGHGQISDFMAFTDFSARRILDGEIPYRDFWAMEAPGSMILLAGAFALFGEEHIVSQCLGMISAALAVACFHRLASRVLAPRIALTVAVLFAVALFSSDCHLYFSTYCPAAACLWVGGERLATFFETMRTRAIVQAGICFGLLAHFRHDMAVLACMAAAGVLLCTHEPPWSARPSPGRKLTRIVILAATAVLTMTPATVALARVAGAAMLDHLVIYPLTDLPHVRGESFPDLWPDWQYASPQQAARGLSRWFTNHAPVALVLIYVLPLWNRCESWRPRQWAVGAFAVGAFALLVVAAFVHPDTHRETLTALAALLAATTWTTALGSSRRPRRTVIACGAGLLVWVAALIAEPGYHLARRWTQGTETAGLPGLRGMRVAPGDAEWMRRLSSVLAEMAAPDTPVFIAARRNDVVVRCSPLAYWLTPRPMATRHHRLQSGVTDTQPAQQRMVKDLESSSLPVLLREYRYTAAELDRVRGETQEDLDIGATLLDEWIAQRYLVGPRYGAYEIMVPGPQPIPVDRPISEKGPIAIELELVAEDLSAPTWLTHAYDGSERLFVVERPGRITVIREGVASTYLDFSDDVITGGERGFLGLAFHPDFAALGASGTGRFYTYSSQPPGTAPPDFTFRKSEHADHQCVIHEWTVSDPNLNEVSMRSGTVSRREVLRIDQPQNNHNGGSVVFARDGTLLMALGDGGGFEGGVDVGIGHTPSVGNGQDLHNVYGSILRIDPLGRETRNRYSVPADNPFDGGNGLREIFAYGLRNPFRISVDRETGAIYAADVGHYDIEEIDLIVAGGNYGWRIKEGSYPFMPGAVEIPADLIDPIAEYDHREGTAIIGGFVYRGSRIPQLRGKYVFGDLSQRTLGAGRLFYLDPVERVIRELRIGADDRVMESFVLGFGEDRAGELYVLTSAGEALRIVPVGDKTRGTGQ